MTGSVTPFFERLCPAMTRLFRNLIVKVALLRVVLSNQPCLPCAGPSFDILLALDCVAHRRKDFEVYELTNAIAFCVAFDASFAMLKDTAHEIIRHTDIQRTAWTT